MGKTIDLLLVEDSEDDAALVIRVLEKGGFEVRHARVESAAQMEAALRQNAWDVVVSDYNLPGFNGLMALHLLRSTGVDIPFILISGTVGEEIAVDAMKAGVNDYIIKRNLSRLASVLERELDEAAIRAEHRQAQRRLIESEAGLRRAQSMAGLSHVITGPDGSFESWSESLPQLIGVDPQQMPETTREWLELIHADERATFRSTCIEADTRGERMSVEYRVRHTNGAWLHIRQVLEPIDSAAGTAAGLRWFNTLQDVTAQKLAEESLRASEARHRAMFEQAAVGIVHSGLDGSVQMANSRISEMSGYSNAELLKLGIRDLTNPEDIEKSALGRAQMLSGTGASYAREVRMLRKDGAWIWIYVATALVRGADGQPSSFISVLSDISERRAQQERIARLSRVQAVLSRINSLIVRVRDRDELFREACRIAVEEGKFVRAWMGTVDRETKRVTRAASAGVEAEIFDAIVAKLNDKSFEGRGLVSQVIVDRQAAISNDIASDPRIFDKERAIATGSRAIAALPLLLGGEVAGVLVLHAGEVGFFDADEIKLLTELGGEISFALEHIEKSEKIDFLAYYDELTGLANRTLFQERLDQHLVEARANGAKLALLLMNIERFKRLNDALGRQAGDDLLRQVAVRLTDAKKEPGKLARLGGDVFGVMLFNLKDAEEVARRTERLIDQLFGASFLIGGAELRVSARSGIAMFPDDGGDAETLFRNAEAALKKAKASGERYLFYTQKMTRRVAERLSLESKLRQAVEKDEFVLHYQPKVDLESRSIVGVEALIRWQSPELGLVPPIKFISLLEESGMILQVGAWALRQAMRDHKDWVAQGLAAPRVAVNVSPIQLRRPDFVASLKEAITEGASPHGLDLEITESLIMEDIESSIEKLKAARELGIQISIDDFGTGYSSLAYLAKLPVQTLKIDRAFIITMLKDPNVMTLVSTMISLAHSLRLNVVAEGVEEEEQAKMLHLLRCEQMQGYLFSKPLPVAELTKLLKQGPGQNPST